MVHRIAKPGHCFGITLVLVTFLCGCGEDWAKRFEYGRVLPNFRIMITLPEPASKVELFQQIERLAHSTGFTEYRGPPNIARMLAADTKSNAFAWGPNEPGEMFYHITVAWMPRESEQPSQVLIIFYNNSMDDFTVNEWLIFKEWKEEILPEAFPESTIEVAGHPAKYTASPMLLEFSRETDIAIPEKYLKDVMDAAAKTVP